MAEARARAARTDQRPGRRRGPPRFPQARPDLLRRPDRPSRLFSRRVRRAARLADRARLRRSRRAAAIPARPGVEPGRLRHRPDARRRAWRARRLGGLHLALGGADARLRLWRGGDRRPLVGRRPAARAEADGGRSDRPGGARHGEDLLRRRAARRDRRGGAGAGRLRSRLARPVGGDRRRRSRRTGGGSRRGVGGGRRFRAATVAPRRARRAGALSRLAGAVVPARPARG